MTWKMLRVPEAVAIDRRRGRITQDGRDVGNEMESSPQIPT